jgi:hypothetical protein
MNAIKWLKFRRQRMGELHVMEEDWTKQDRPPQLPLLLPQRLLVALLCCIKGPPAQRH